MTKSRGRSGERKKIFAGRYAYSRPLGRGAGGAVYLCEDLQADGRQAAVKVLSAEAFATVQGKMIKREFEILSKLDHPNLVRVFDYGPLPDGGVFLAEEYVDGFSLQDARALVQPEALIDITMQMLHGLSYLHGMGMIHRDIKPANVMLLWLDDAKARPMVKLVDFGLSSMDPKKDTLRGGTRSYMAPEIIRGEKGELRSDLYSLGVTLYYALCGVLPFGPRTKADPPPTDEPFRPPDPHRLNPDVPLNLSRFTMILLRQVENIDFADAGEALQHLARDSEALEWIATGTLANSLDIAAPPVLRGYFERGIIAREAQNRDRLVDRLLADTPTGRMYVVRGGAAVGKSRLAREVTAAVKLGGRIVVMNECEGGYPPFGLLLHILRSLIDIAESRGIQLGERIRPSVNMLARLAQLIGHTKTAEEREEDASWIREAFEDLAVVLHPERVVIVVEDMHLADEDSVRFLKTWFNERDAFHRPFFVATVRPGGACDALTACRDVDVIEVQGLQSEDVRYLFETRLGVRDLPESWMEKVAVASNGNPSYAEEITRSLIDAGTLTRRSAIQWSVETDELLSFSLPKGLKESFRRRLSAFGKAGRETLELMALLDRPIEWSVLRKLLMAGGEREDEADRMIEVLRWRHFVFLDLDTSGRYLRLIDPRLRDVITEQMNPEWRRALHRRIGERLQKHWMRGDARSPEVADHLERGGHARASALWEIAGDRQRWRDVDAAKEAYTHALACADDGPAHALLATKLAENALARGERDEALAHLETAWCEAERTALDWLIQRVTLTGIRVTLATGEYSGASDWLARISDVMPVLAQQGRARVSRAQIEIARGRLDVGYRELLAAQAQFEHFGNETGAAVACTHLGRIKRLQGDFEGAAATGVEAVARARDVEAWEALGPALLAFGVLLRHTGEFDEAQAVLNEAFDYLSEFGGVDLCAEVLIELGENHLLCGELERARRRASEAAQLAETLGHRLDQLRAEMLLSELDVREVNGVEAALKRINVAVEEVCASPYGTTLAPFAMWRLGQAHVKAGRKDEGRVMQKQARELAAESGITLPV